MAILIVVPTVGGTDRRADGARCGKVHGARIHRRAEDRGWQGDDVATIRGDGGVENPVIAVSESVSTTPPLMMRVSLPDPAVTLVRLVTVDVVLMASHTPRPTVRCRLWWPDQFRRKYMHQSCHFNRFGVSLPFANGPCSD